MVAAPVTRGLAALANPTTEAYEKDGMKGRFARVPVDSAWFKFEPETSMLLFLIWLIPAFHACAASSELKLLGRYSTTNWVRGLAVSGNYAYLGEVPYAFPNFSAKLLAIDIRKPEMPQKVGEYAATFSDFAVYGNYAYLRTDSSVNRIDFSNPAKPKEVGGFGIGGDPSRPPGLVMYMAASSNYICVAAFYGVTRFLSREVYTSLLMLDISDPSNPKGPTTLFTAGGTFGIDGRPLPVADYAGPLAIAGKYAYQPPKILDLTTRRQVGSIEETGLPLKVFGSYLYLATDRLKIIDIRDPEKPRKAGEYPGGVSDVAVSGNYAYLAKGSSGLEVIDIADPARPVRVSTNSAFAASRVTVAGGRVYVATFDRDLIILDEYQPETQSQIRFEQVSRGSQGELRLRLVGPFGVTGRLQQSTNLLEWIDRKAVSFTGTAIDFSDPSASAQQRFYRVIAP